MSVDLLFSNPRDVIRRAEKKFYDEVIDTIQRNHRNPEDMPTPTSFYEDRIAYTVRLPSSLGARSAVWLDLQKAIRTMGFDSPTLIDQGYAITYAIIIPE